MEIVGILRVLWRHRLLVVLGGVVLVVLVLAGTHRIALDPPHVIAHKTVSGRATARLLLTSPQAPFAGAQRANDQSNSMGLRSAFLADEMAADAARRDIARRAGIWPSQLVVFGPVGKPPADAVPLAVSAASSAARATAPYTINTTADGTVPIVTLEVSAPSPREAARLVGAFSAAMAARVRTDNRSNVQLSVQPLGPPDVRRFVARTQNGLTFVIAVATIILWLAAIVIIAPLGRGPGGPRRGRRGRPKPVVV